VLSDVSHVSHVTMKLIASKILDTPLRTGSLHHPTSSHSRNPPGIGNAKRLLDGSTWAAGPG